MLDIADVLDASAVDIVVGTSVIDVLEATGIVDAYAVDISEVRVVA